MAVNMVHGERQIWGIQGYDVKFQFLRKIRKT